MNSDQELQDQEVPPETQEETEAAEAEDFIEDVGKVDLEEKPDKEEEEDELKEMQQRYLRLTADFENYRRRKQQENAEIRRIANERLLRDIITIIDNFERALDAAKKELPDNIITGIEMIYRQLQNLLSQEGVEPVESVGKPFDPVYQDAFKRIETTEFPEGTVTAEVQKGYLLHGKVLRPALVIVAKKPETEIKSQSKSCQKGACIDE